MRQTVHKHWLQTLPRMGIRHWESLIDRATPISSLDRGVLQCRVPVLWVHIHGVWEPVDAGMARYSIRCSQIVGLADTSLEVGHTVSWRSIPREYSGSRGDLEDPEIAVIQALPHDVESCIAASLGCIALNVWMDASPEGMVQRWYQADMLLGRSHNT